MTDANPLMIVMIGVADLEDKVNYLYDPMLFHAFLLMSLNLAEATYEADEYEIDNTLPLQFSFTDRSLILRKHPTQPGITHLIRDHLLPSSDGVIINLRHAVPADSRNPLAPLFREMIKEVHTSKRPAVFATNSTTIEGDWHSEPLQARVQPVPSVIECVREIFSDTVPIVGYDYIKPGSVQTILTTLLAEIEKGYKNNPSLAQKSHQNCLI